MTTIGTAVLQIIPSLRGVTEAIEAQIDGKVVSVSVEPKVDQRATEAAAKQTRETVEKQTTQVKVEPKVDTRAAEQAGKATGEAVTKGAKDAVTKGDIGKTVSDSVKDSVEKSSPGKDLAKILVEGMADGVKGELRGGPLVDEFVDGLADGVKQGIDQAGTGGQIVEAITGGIKSGNLTGSIRDAILPGIKSIGTDLRSNATDWATGIADSLRSGDIQGATDDIGSTVRNTTDIIANIGATFGLQLDGVREFGDGSAAMLSTVGSNVQSILSTATTMKSTFADTGELLGAILPGRAGAGAKSIINSLGTIIPVATTVYEILNAGAQEWHAAQQERFWQRQQTESRARELGLKPPQPGIGDVGGPPAVGQGNAPAAPPKPRVGEDLRSKVAAGQLPGFSIGPNGAIVGPDGKPVPGYSPGGFTGNFPADKIAGVVHGKEFVLKAVSQERIESDYPGLLDHMNATGKLPGYDGGGLVGPDVSVARALAGTPYSQGNRTDCSGMVSRVILQSLGKSGGLMTTKNADKWLTALGFRSGTGGPGAITVGWYDRGPNPNDGHMAMTLSDGTHAEAGGRNSVFTLGDRARGGGDSTFDRHMFLTLASGKGPASGDGQITGQGPATGGTPTAGPAGEESGGSSGGGFSVPSSLSGLATLPFDSMVSNADSGEGHRDPNAYFPKAASAAVGGQLSSALGVFGVSDTPGWLKGVSDLVGGISVSDKSGKKIFGGSSAASALGGLGSLAGNTGQGPDYGGAAPIAASMSGVSAPDAAHGGTGQAPGPASPAGPTYNIRTATVEDAFTLAQQQEKVRLASKLDRY